MQLSAIYIYPIKSLRGIFLDECELTPIGLQNDRLWMLIDENNRYITQRQIHILNKFKVILEQPEIIVVNTQNNETISFDVNTVQPEFIEAQVWDDICQANEVSRVVSNWFQKQLGITCKLVKLNKTANRQVDLKYARKGEYTTFTDGFPFLMIGESSLDLLNSKLETPLLINRFRPNLVFKGGEPHSEDQMGTWQIGESAFNAVKLCSRCIVTTIDEESSLPNKEPLKTLANYRRIDKKIMFGQNLLYKSGNCVKVGDEVSYTSSPL